MSHRKADLSLVTSTLNKAFPPGVPLYLRGRTWTIGMSAGKSGRLVRNFVTFWRKLQMCPT